MGLILFSFWNAHIQMCAPLDLRVNVVIPLVVIWSSLCKSGQVNSSHRKRVARRTFLRQRQLWGDSIRLPHPGFFSFATPPFCSGPGPSSFCLNSCNSCAWSLFSHLVFEQQSLILIEALWGLTNKTKMTFYTHRLIKVQLHNSLITIPISESSYGWCSVTASASTTTSLRFPLVSPYQENSDSHRQTVQFSRLKLKRIWESLWVTLEGLHTYISLASMQFGDCGWWKSWTNNNVPMSLVGKIFTIRQKTMFKCIYNAMK